jgi:hypothetical protein
MMMTTEELVTELESELVRIKKSRLLQGYVLGYESCIRDAKIIIKEKESLPTVQVKSLKEFLKESGDGEYRLVINNGVFGYIHPLGRDGETLDFTI